MTSNKRDEDKRPTVRTREIPHEKLFAVLAQRRERARFGEDRPSATAARQPAQPASGPGGARYVHRSVKSNLFGESELAYWIFEPGDPTPRSAPVVVMLHGWGGGTPARCGAWIEHLVKRGHIVIFPLYQGSLNPWSRPWTQIRVTGIAQNAIVALKEALARLGSGGHVRPDLDRCAMLGISLGGALAAQLAASADKQGLPIPKAIMPIMPSRGSWARRPLPPVSLRTIAPSTLMVVVTCDNDKNTGDEDARAIFTRTPQIPRANRNLVMLVSDYHGTPPLVANHYSPTASSASLGLQERDVTPPHALHYFGYWKLFDGLTEAAFHGTHREFALGNTAQQRFMGAWSDGVPVEPLRVLAGAGVTEAAPPPSERPGPQRRFLRSPRA